jgi:hypothetical protein
MATVMLSLRDLSDFGRKWAFSFFWATKTAYPPFKNACTGILERRLFQNDQSPTVPSGTKYILRAEALIKLALMGFSHRPRPEVSN